MTDVALQTPAPEIPDKLYFKIGEVSELLGVEPYVLRYWETEFRSIRPQKSRKGQRIYSRRDVDRLLKVKDLLYTHGFTIAGARRRLRETGLEPPTAAEARPATPDDSAAIADGLAQAAGLPPAAPVAPRPRTSAKRRQRR